MLVAYGVLVALSGRRFWLSCSARELTVATSAAAAAALICLAPVKSVIESARSATLSREFLLCCKNGLMAVREAAKPESTKH